MSLAEYTRKRDFSKTKEPDAAAQRPPKATGSGSFVIQKHDASRLHYDLRLEHKGVLLSWAVPKGPSLDPGEKRLAVRVEDHPLDYAAFEGAIPKGEYGAGTVMLWDQGEWSPKSDVQRGLKKGKLSFTLQGERLNGGWHLARMRGDSGSDKENWLLIKSDDAYASPGDNDALLKENDRSVATGRDLDGIAKGVEPVANNQSDAIPAPRKTGKLPRALSPQLATLVSEVPQGDDWVHEIKYDGYRFLAFCDRASVTLLTRNGKDWTSKLPAIRRAFEALDLDRCVVDGELIASESDGRSSFQSLQNALKDKKTPTALQFMAFDLPFALGRDLQKSSLLERKRLLRSLLDENDPNHVVRYSDHVIGHGADVFKNACKLGLEGIICKKASSPYINKRSRYWLKVKCDRRQEFLICGFTEPSGSRRGFGALHLAYYQKDQLVYAGKVGTGFDQKSLLRMRRELEKLAIKTCPLAEPPSDNDATTWVKAELVAEIKFAERTKDGLLRQASFLGLREDKPARSVRWEAPQASPSAATDSPASRTTASKTRKRSKKTKKTSASSAVSSDEPRLTNPDRLLYPKAGLTKERIAAYYRSVAEWMLPYVARRPLALLRHPRGWTEKGFFQKHIDDAFPVSVKRIDIPDGGSSSVYGYVDSSDGLVALLQMGTLEIHTWGSRIDDVEKPDTLVMDLDPDEGLPSETVVGAALLLRDMLKEKANLQCFLKSTGGKGLHVVIPIRRGPDWQTAKSFSKSVAEALKAMNPGAFTTTASKQKRKDKIFIDYLRNGRGATAVAPYSTRAREGATVAVPLSWEEAQPSLRSDHYSVNNVLRRLAQLKADPWADYFELKQGLTKATRQAFALD